MWAYRGRHGGRRTRLSPCHILSVCLVPGQATSSLRYHWSYELKNHGIRKRKTRPYLSTCGISIIYTPSRPKRRLLHHLQLARNGKVGVRLGPDLVDLDARRDLGQGQGAGLAVYLEYTLRRVSYAPSHHPLVASGSEGEEESRNKARGGENSPDP